MKYITSNDVAKILGINISTLKRWTENGTIDCIKTKGGHRKFTIQHIRKYYKNNKQAKKSIQFGLNNSNHKKIYEYINQFQFSKLTQILADASLESDDLTINTIVNGCYMKGIEIEIIFDEIIDPGSMIVENALQKNYISHLESFISRKIITRVVEGLNLSKPNGSFNGKTALCINFENNLPDLGVVMSEVILRHCGYNVLNTGSHAKLGDLVDILNKKSINLILFYLCDMQCCMATVAKNLKKTENQVIEITELANKLKVKVLFGGSGLQFIGKGAEKVNFTFTQYSELKKIL